ncbi:hypothetical protein [Paenibacillus sp. FSL H7-0323]|uniref:hypothetical protein n=1 Tax=Paenibacillus sp. FSL H7-0323 TaxID=2921433 RepID=UPI0030FACAF3
MNKGIVFNNWIPKVSEELKELDVHIDKKKVYEEWLPELEREYGLLHKEYINKKSDAQAAKARMKFVRKIAKPLGSRMEKACKHGLMYESLTDEYDSKQKAFQAFDNEKGDRLVYLKYLITALRDTIKAPNTEHFELKAETRAEESSTPLQ